MDARAIILSLIALCFSAVLSTLHLALADLSRGLLEEFAQRRGGPGEAGGLRHVRKIVDDISGHARAMGMARVACNLAFAVGVVWCVASVHTGWGIPISPDLDPVPIHDGSAEVASLTLFDVLIGTCVATAILWTVSVSLAESLARHAGERLVYAFSPLVRSVHTLMYPLKPLAGAIDRGVQRFFGRGKEEQQAEFEAELLSVVEEGERGGQFDESDREMIEAIVDMRNLTVEQIMTPRMEIEALELTDNLGLVAAFVRKATHSRIPVYRDNVDDVVGIFYVKDLLRWLAGATQPPPGAGGAAGSASGTNTAASSGTPRAKGEQPRLFSLMQIVRPAMFVPETKTVRETLNEMLQKKVHIAVVADEYGGTAGVVSLEDIVECVFGEIQDEYELPEDEPPRIEVKLHTLPTAEAVATAAGTDAPASPIDGAGASPVPASAISGGTADADARAYIDDVNDALEPLGVALPEGDEYDTLGGFVLAHLGRIPSEGEEFMHDRVRVKVVEATPTRVLRVRLEVAPAQTPRSEEPVHAEKSESSSGTNAPK